MPKGINSSYYKYKVIQADNNPKYYKLINEIMEEYNIRKNTIYNIINKKRNISKCKKGLDLKIEKIKLPVRKSVYMKISELNKM